MVTKHLHVAKQHKITLESLEKAYEAHILGKEQYMSFVKQYVKQETDKLYTANNVLNSVRRYVERLRHGHGLGNDANIRSRFNLNKKYIKNWCKNNL